MVPKAVKIFPLETFLTQLSSCSYFRSAKPRCVLHICLSLLILCCTVSNIWNSTRLNRQSSAQYLPTARVETFRSVPPWEPTCCQTSHQDTESHQRCRGRTQSVYAGDVSRNFSTRSAQATTHPYTCSVPRYSREHPFTKKNPAQRERTTGPSEQDTNSKSPHVQVLLVAKLYYFPLLVPVLP